MSTQENLATVGVAAAAYVAASGIGKSDVETRNWASINQALNNAEIYRWKDGHMPELNGNPVHTILVLEASSGFFITSSLPEDSSQTAETWVPGQQFFNQEEERQFEARLNQYPVAISLEGNNRWLNWVKENHQEKVLTPDEQVINSLTNAGLPGLAVIMAGLYTYDQARSGKNQQLISRRTFFKVGLAFGIWGGAGLLGYNLSQELAYRHQVHGNNQDYQLWRKNPDADSPVEIAAQELFGDINEIFFKRREQIMLLNLYSLGSLRTGGLNLRIEIGGGHRDMLAQNYTRSWADLTAWTKRGLQILEQTGKQLDPNDRVSILQYTQLVKDFFDLYSSPLIRINLPNYQKGMLPDYDGDLDGGQAINPQYREKGYLSACEVLVKAVTELRLTGQISQDLEVRLFDFLVDFQNRYTRSVPGKYAIRYPGGVDRVTNSYMLAGYPLAFSHGLLTGFFPDYA